MQDVWIVTITWSAEELATCRCGKMVKKDGKPCYLCGLQDFIDIDTPLSELLKDKGNIKKLFISLNNQILEETREAMMELIESKSL